MMNQWSWHSVGRTGSADDADWGLLCLWKGVHSHRHSARLLTFIFRLLWLGKQVLHVRRDRQVGSLLGVWGLNSLGIDAREAGGQVKVAQVAE